jgi:hypothetical protein
VRTCRFRLVKERYEAARQGEAACKKVIGENQFEAAKVCHVDVVHSCYVLCVFFLCTRVCMRKVFVRLTHALIRAQATMEAVDALAEGWLSKADEVLSSIWQFETALTKLHKMQNKSTRVWGADEVCVFDKETCRKQTEDASNAVHTHINVLVTNGELVPTIAKLPLFG